MIIEMESLVVIELFIFGSLLGSFACAQVWRLRARQLVDDSTHDDTVDRQELKRLRGLIRPMATDRSECLYCHHKLAWYDLIPIVSWLMLAGKCRYCGKFIGYTEILAEIGLALAFVVSFLLWPFQFRASLDVGIFVVWLIVLVILTILLIYDTKWSLLPLAINVLLIALTIVFRTLVYVEYGGIDILSLVIALLILGGIYILFSLFGWVGLGDGILGLGLAILLGSWPLAFLTLFLANLLGSLAIIPLYLKKVLRKHMKIPFGPFLIVATFVCFLVGDNVIAAYLSLSGL